MEKLGCYCSILAFHQAFVVHSDALAIALQHPTISIPTSRYCTYYIRISLGVTTSLARLFDQQRSSKGKVRRQGQMWASWILTFSNLHFHFDLHSSLRGFSDVMVSSSSGSTLLTASSGFLSAQSIDQSTPLLYHALCSNIEDI